MAPGGSRCRFAGIRRGWRSDRKLRPRCRCRTRALRRVARRPLRRAAGQSTHRRGSMRGRWEDGCLRRGLRSDTRDNTDESLYRTGCTLANLHVRRHGPERQAPQGAGPRDEREAAPHSEWLYELLKPHVDESVVIQPWKNGGQKSDSIDAWGLAEWIRTGSTDGLVSRRRDVHRAASGCSCASS
jgi:hypothetical protein